MSEEYSCDICGTHELRSNNWKGSGSTLENCKACDEYLKQAPGRLLNSPSPLSINGTRTRIAAVLMHRNRTLEALNFCLSSLNRASPACSSHVPYNRMLAFGDLARFQKSDFDPDSPPPLNLQPRPHSDLLYTLTLSAFKVYGPSTFAVSCLRRAYHCNPSIFRALSKRKEERSSDYYGMGFEGQETYMYLILERIWVETPGVREWLGGSEEEVKRRACDAVECGKVGGCKMCKGCGEWWYCGVECQERDWKVGGHRKVCKESKLALRRVRGMDG